MTTPLPQPPTVTVLVSTRDRPDLLDRCLRSLLRCTPPPDDVVVVDQSSDDSSLRVVTALGTDLVRHVRDPERGLSVAQNKGFAQATGDVVLVTDDDCVLPREWVGRARDAFACDEQLGLLGGRVLPLGDDAPDRMAVSTRTSTAPLLLDASSLPWDVGSGNNFALRRSVALAVAGNDERLGPGAPLKGGADMDLFRRVLRSGAHGRYAPDVVVLHERATQAERMDRRIPYGYGMGACLVLWAKQGDRGVARLARAWVRLRLHRLYHGLRGRNLVRVREEVLVLVGTGRGAASALKAPAGPVTRLTPATT